jgi:hypothetical protein
MNAIFQITFLIGLALWIAIDYKKVKAQRSSLFMFWLINILSVVLFIAISLNNRPLTPVKILNDIVSPWAKAITGGIMYDKTSD